MPDQLTPDQLASYGVTSDAELRAKVAKAAEADKIEADSKIELEAARGQMRLAAANGFVAAAKEKIPPALHDEFRAVHMGLSEHGSPIEFARPSSDGLSTETIKKDPLAALATIVGKLGKAIELQDENAPEGGTDQEHLTDEEKAAKKVADDAAAAKKAEEEKGGDDTTEGTAMSIAAVELGRAGYGTDAYGPPEGLEAPKKEKDEKK